MTSQQLGRSGPHHPAIRPRPRHQRRRARRAGGDQRRARRPADQPAQQPDLPQGQPGRRADPDPGADLEDPDARASSTTPPPTCCSSSCRRSTGIGEVDRRRRALPAVRVELNPTALFKYGIGLEDVRAALASANANSPKGAIEDGDQHCQIYTNDQASHAGRIPASGRRLPQRRARCGCRTSPRSMIRWRICATRGLPTASRRWW